MQRGPDTRHARSAFELWLRAGRWLPAQLDDPALEVKFNPYHDPIDGQFTFAPGGEGDSAGMASRPKRPRREKGDGSWGGGFGGGGSGGAAGASGDGYWMNAAEQRAFRQRHPRSDPLMVRPGETLDQIAAARHIATSKLRALNGIAFDATIKPGQVLALPKAEMATRVDPTLRILKNGYTFRLDRVKRTDRITGELTLAEKPLRSTHNQRVASKPDRRPDDDGGISSPPGSTVRLTRSTTSRRTAHSTAVATETSKRGGRMTFVPAGTCPSRLRRLTRAFPGGRTASTLSRQSTAMHSAEPSTTGREINDMAVDKFDLLGPAMAKIGEKAYDAIGGRPDGIYLYVEIGDGWVDTSLFKDEGDHVQYYWGNHSLPDAVMDAWCLDPADKRWTAMHYTIEGGKFNAAFEFDDLEGSSEDGGDRRERILRARYGDKVIIYPPLSGDVMELKPPS